MDAMRQAWTDERLDDLASGMHREFDRVHTELRSLRTMMVAGFASIVASVVGSVAAVLVAHAL